MSETRRCPHCGKDLAPDAPEGLCPVCLLQQAMPTQSLAAPPDPGRQSFGVPPGVEWLAGLFPQLEILERLGQGGMGVVYKARQRDLDRLVALKILPPDVGRDPAFAERFGREARALARLNHPNIVAVYDFGQRDGLYYFLMEYVEGVNLRQVLRNGQLRPSEALQIVPQICEALQYAHNEGIVHRDIKPENILLDKKGRVKIADFGLARLLGRTPADFTLTASHQVMGTPHYMAPEQMEKPLTVDHRADIYSLGVVFYELLTGELPLGHFVPPSQKVQVDVRLDEVVLRALAREPERRYQQVSEVKTDVESITRETHPPTPGVGSPALPDHVLFRRTTILMLLGLGLWAVVLGAFAWGDLARADWARKGEFPREFLGTLLEWLTPALLVYGSWWYYLLAKKPETPRSFRDYWEVMKASDPRIKKIWKPILIFLVLYWIALAVLMAVFGVGENGPLLLVMYGTMILAPLGMIALLWRTMRGGTETGPAPGSGGTPLPAAVVREHLKWPAVGLALTGFLALVPAILLGISWATTWQGQPATTFWPGWLVQVGAGVDRWLASWKDHAGLLVVSQFLTVPLAGVILLAALQMRKLHYPGLAIAGSILAMVPCHLGWFLGLPMGLWALWVLRNPEVKAAFQGTQHSG